MQIQKQKFKKPLGNLKTEYTTIVTKMEQQYANIKKHGDSKFNIIETHKV